MRSTSQTGCRSSALRRSSSSCPAPPRPPGLRLHPPLQREWPTYRCWNPVTQTGGDAQTPSGRTQIFLCCQVLKENIFLKGPRYTRVCLAHTHWHKRVRHSPSQQNSECELLSAVTSLFIHSPNIHDTHTHSRPTLLARCVVFSPNAASLDASVLQNLRVPEVAQSRQLHEGKAVTKISDVIRGETHLKRKPLKKKVEGKKKDQ